MNGEETKNSLARTVQAEGPRVKAIEKTGDTPEETRAPREEATGPQARTCAAARPGQTRSGQACSGETPATAPRPAARGYA